MNKEINIVIEGSAFTRNQVENLVEELNKTIEDADKITIKDVTVVDITIILWVSLIIYMLFVISAAL